MARIALLYDKPSLLISSMKSQFEALGHIVCVSELSMSELSKIKDKQDAVMIYADEDLSDNTEALVYIKDKALENDMGIFVGGDKEEIDRLNAIVPNTILVGKFTRPINIKNVVEVIDAYVNDETRTARKKVLVVDDSGAMLRNVKGWLEDKYDVALANSGAQAIRYLSVDRPDLILLDYEMPVANGKQVLEMIRSEMSFQDIPVIFLTSKADKQSVIDVMSLRPEGYLLKTMPPDEIVKSVDDFFEKKRIEMMSR